MVIDNNKKKRVTAGEVDKLGKELGNCTRQRKTNDDTNTLALSTLSLLQVKEERQTTTEGRKKQRRGQTRRRQPKWIKGISTKKSWLKFLVRFLRDSFIRNLYFELFYPLN